MLGARRGSGSSDGRAPGDATPRAGLEEQAAAWRSRALAERASAPRWGAQFAAFVRSFELLLEEMGVRIEAARGMREAVIDLLDESAGAPPSRGLEVENCTLVRAAVRAALRSTDHTSRGWKPVPGVGAAAG